MSTLFSLISRHHNILHGLCWHICVQSRRELEDLTTLKLRPDTCTNKQGDSGRPLQLVTNFINVYPAHDWKLYQHHVTFDTVIDSRLV